MSTAKKMKMKMATTKAGWSGLDDLALEEITGRMTLYRDFAALRMVCTSWRSSLQDFKFKCRMPWLMLPPKRGSNLYEFFIFPQVEEQVQGGMITQQHLAIPESNIFPQVEPVQGTTLPKLAGFSSKGWLLDIVERPLSFNLLHPFSGAQIKLPQWPKTRNLFIYKFVLSSNPSSTLNCTVMLLYYCYGGPGRIHLIYSKPSDKAWTTINTGQNDLHDVIYFEGKFYVVNSNCQIMACDVTGDNQTMTRVANMPESLLPKDSWDEVYIVESSRGRLLVVTKVEWHWRRGRRRTRRGRSRKTTNGIYEFQVFEVDLSTNSWTKMKDLGNKTLFLDKNSSSICIESDGVYFKPNRIFFMDHYSMDAIHLFNKYGGTHVRIYNIEDGSIESYFSGDPCNPHTPYNDWNPTPLFVEQCFYK